ACETRQLSFNRVRALKVIWLCWPGWGKEPQAGFYRLREERRPRSPLNCSVARSARNVRIEGDSFDSLSHPSRISFGTCGGGCGSKRAANLTILAVKLGRRACTMIADLAVSVTTSSGSLRRTAL